VHKRDRQLMECSKMYDSKLRTGYDTSMDSHVSKMIKYVKIRVENYTNESQSILQQSSGITSLVVHEMGLGTSSTSSSLILRVLRDPLVMLSSSFSLLFPFLFPRIPSWRDHRVPNCNSVVGEAAALSPIS